MKTLQESEKAMSRAEEASEDVQGLQQASGTAQMRLQSSLEEAATALVAAIAGPEN